MDETVINNIEEATRDQSSSGQCKKERKFRFTASKFDLISKRQRNHEKFSADLINPKPITSPIPFEAATLMWWDGLQGLMILLGYTGGSYTPGRFNLAGQAIRGGS